MTTLPTIGQVAWGGPLNSALAEIDSGDGARPADHGLLSWSLEPSQAANTHLLTADVWMTKLWLRQPASITNLVTFIATAGSGLTAGQCFAGLYDSAGTLVGQTVDQSGLWTTAGTHVMPLTVSYSAAAGAYYVALLANGTTLPTMVRETQITGGTQQMVNIGLTAATARAATAGAATTLPATITMAARTMAAQSLFVAVS